jgi:hypothetical protein
LAAGGVGDPLIGASGGAFLAVLGTAADALSTITRIPQL